MRTVRSSDDTMIAYVQNGSGPHLVLVHGMATIRAQWAAIFEQDFTVTAMDRRGRGGSGDAPDYAIEREFEDIVAVVESLDGPAILFGHSYGALCALGAAMLTDRLAGLVLYEPSLASGEPLYSQHQMVRIETLVAGGDDEAAVIALMAELAAIPPHEIEQMRSSASWPKRVATARTIPREMRTEQSYRLPFARARQLSLPVLLLLGGDSPPELTKGARELQEILPNARTVVMRGEQHVAMYTNPDLLVAAVRAFSREIVSKP